MVAGRQVDRVRVRGFRHFGGLRYLLRRRGAPPADHGIDRQLAARLVAGWGVDLFHLPAIWLAPDLENSVDWRRPGADYVRRGLRKQTFRGRKVGLFFQ